MPIGELKPVLAALVLPPGGPLLLVLAAFLLTLRHRAAGVALGVAGVASLWLLSCNAVGLALVHRLLPQVDAISPVELRQVQAVVVLGGGVLPLTSDYGTPPQPSATTLARTRYGAGLAKQAHKPLAFSGGIGWSAAGSATATEASTAHRIASQQGVVVRWSDDRARDTAENALRMAELLQPAGIRRIALVTDPWHMPRASQAFVQAGFEVAPAPTTVPLRQERRLLEWLPSAHGLATSRQALREWLALKWDASPDWPAHSPREL
jgi:uncharacterized SAM-binding protein YcdF (DUF218 family)